MTPLLSVLFSGLAGALLAGIATFTGIQVIGDGSSDQGAISAPLVEYGSRLP